MIWQVATAHESDHGLKHRTAGTHLICVYTDNYADEDEVMRVEKELRSLGITGTLCYKPDIYTYLNIYANNPYKIKASVYTTKDPSS